MKVHFSRTKQIEGVEEEEWWGAHVEKPISLCQGFELGINCSGSEIRNAARSIFDLQTSATQRT